MYTTCIIYEIPDGKKVHKVKVDFDKVFSIQLRYNIESDDAVLQYLYEKYRKLFPRFGHEIFDRIHKDYKPYENMMYDMSIYDWI